MNGVDDLAAAFKPERPLVLVGAGNMGMALLRRWIDVGVLPSSLRVIDPAPRPDHQSALEAAGLATEPRLAPEVAPRVIVIGVKPQIVGEVLPGLKPSIRQDTLTLSVVAGATMATLQAGLDHATVVRCIPNTPAQIGLGASACVATAGTGEADRLLATGLLAAVGEVVWVDNEALIDVATAVSGSGPAYVFLLAEALAAAGVAEGLDRDTAERLAAATIEGAGALLTQSDETAAVLRERVTSPNGTTAAALAVLMADNGVPDLVARAVAAATRRSRELSSPTPEEGDPS